MRTPPQFERIGTESMIKNPQSIDMVKLGHLSDRILAVSTGTIVMAVALPPDENREFGLNATLTYAT